MERSIRQIRQAKFSLPIKDRSSILRHLLRVDSDYSSDINLLSLSLGRGVSMQLVSWWVLQVCWGQRVCPPERPRGE